MLEASGRFALTVSHGLNPLGVAPAKPGLTLVLVILRASAQGVGIPEADRAFVFEAFHHTQDTDRYSTKNPYDFNAGGKGLELMQLKILADEGCFDIWFETQRCQHLVAGEGNCPQRISACGHVTDKQGCALSGGTTFSVLFREPKD
jgi:two-component system phosphate regulon sensor histidine kinase PhoR